MSLNSVIQIAAGDGYSVAMLPAPAVAVSRKMHSAAGAFDVELPLAGTPGIECRTGGSTNDHQLVLTYAGDVSVNGNPQAAVTLGSGTIGIGGTSNGGTATVSGNTVTIPLTNITNAQKLEVTVFGVNGAGDLVVPVNILAGDVNGNGAVNASDVALAKSRSGQPVDGTSFKSDVNANGSCNASDVALIKSKAGTGLP
jgi:hypothetical protein